MKALLSLLLTVPISLLAGVSGTPYSPVAGGGGSATNVVIKSGTGITIGTNTPGSDYTIRLANSINATGTFSGTMNVSNFVYDSADFKSWTDPTNKISYYSNKLTQKYSTIDSNLNTTTPGTNTSAAFVGPLAGDATGLASGATTTNLTKLGKGFIYANKDFTNYSPYIMFGSLQDAWGGSEQRFRATNGIALLFGDVGIPNPALENTTDPTVANHNFSETRIRFEAWTNASYFEWFWNPYHDKGGQVYGGDEMQQTCSGGWAIGLGYLMGGINNDYSIVSGAYTNYNNARRAWQWGAGGEGQPYIYHQYSNVRDADNTNLFGAALPEMWKALYWSNNVLKVVGEADGERLPAMWFKAVDTNGAGAWIWYDALSYLVDENLNWQNQQTATKRFEIHTGTDGGIKINGGITINGAVGLTTNFPISETLSAFFSNGLLTAISPTPVYVLDTNAASYIEAIGGTTETISNALNTLVLTLKSDGTWTNFDAFYPFAASSIESNAFNLIDTNTYYITWGGTYTTNDYTGIVSDGSTGYGDTGWKSLLTNNCGGFVMCKTNIANTSWVLGAKYDTFGEFAVWRDGAGWKAPCNSHQTTATAVGVASPWALSFGRTNSTDVHVNYTSSSGNAYLAYAHAVTNSLNLNIFVSGLNNVGSPYFNGVSHIQFVGLGGGYLSPTQFTNLLGACEAFNTALER